LSHVHPLLGARLHQHHLFHDCKYRDMFVFKGGTVPVLNKELTQKLGDGEWAWYVHFYNGFADAKIIYN